MLAIFIIVCGALIASVILTGLVRRYAVAKGILDVPNIRSSHTKITPRGGGLAIAIVYLGGMLILGLLRLVPPNLALALVGGGLAVTIVGWVDDKTGLSAKIRGLVHVLGATWVVFMVGGFPYIELGIARINLGLFGSILAVIGIVWMINLYNFMDGIDGLAAGEAVCVALTAGTFLLVDGHLAVGLTAYLLAAAAGGFLLWNWPPAKIFMGDVSSGLLGFSFAVLAIASENVGGIPVLGWVLLLGVFVVDATATLVRRLLGGERWYDAHRTHAYQLAVSGGRSHKYVTLIIMFLNLFLVGLGGLVWLWSSLLLPSLILGLAFNLYIWWLITDKYLPRRICKQVGPRAAR